MPNKKILTLFLTLIIGFGLGWGYNFQEISKLNKELKITQAELKNTSDTLDNERLQRKQEVAKSVESDSTNNKPIMAMINGTPVLCIKIGVLLDCH